MRQELTEVENRVDDNGNPSGGYVKALGISIKWQDGPLGRHAEACQPEVPAEEKLGVCADGCTRREPNGAFVEGVILAALTRLRFFEEASEARFSCPENREAIEHLNAALIALDKRTTGREERKVEGTHTA